VEYLDGIGGLFTTQIGHGRKEMADMIANQIMNMEFQVNGTGYSNIPCILLAEKIVSLAKRAFPDMRSAYFTTGGAESNEAAFHLCLRYWEQRGYKSKRKMLSFNNCYHGTTYVVASANPDVPTYGQGRQIRGPKDYIQIDFPNESVFSASKIRENETLGQAAARELEETIIREGADNIACFLFEPIQGGEGTVVPHDDYWPLAKQICQKYNVLMIADEVMTGFGRTGKWFAMEHWNVQADVITFAKGVTSGYIPLGGLIMSEEIYNKAINVTSSSNPWVMDYTYSGHPVACIAGLTNIEIMERENLVDECAQKGPIFLQKLQEKVKDLPIVKYVRGKGMLFTVELKEQVAKDAEKRLLQEERVVGHAGLNQVALDFAPSFILREDQWDQIVEAVYKVLSTYRLRNAVESVKEMGKDAIGSVIGTAQKML